MDDRLRVGGADTQYEAFSVVGVAVVVFVVVVVAVVLSSPSDEGQQTELGERLLFKCRRRSWREMSRQHLLRDRGNSGSSTPGVVSLFCFVSFLPSKHGSVTLSLFNDHLFCHFVTLCLVFFC